MCVFWCLGLGRREDLDQFDLEDDHVSIFKLIRMSQEWATVVGVTEAEYLRV